MVVRDNTHASVRDEVETLTVIRHSVCCIDAFHFASVPAWIKAYWEIYRVTSTSHVIPAKKPLAAGSPRTFEILASMLHVKRCVAIIEASERSGGSPVWIHTT